VMAYSFQVQLELVVTVGGRHSKTWSDKDSTTRI
jgi:hypothetical protein